MPNKTLLVAGALGVIGRALIEHCAATDNARIIGLSRRSASLGRHIEHRAVDLCDTANCQQNLAGLERVTHLVYAAWQPRPTRGQEVAPNLAMLCNLMEGLDRTAPHLRHVTLLQGAKAYDPKLSKPRILWKLFSRLPTAALKNFFKGAETWKPRKRLVPNPSCRS